MQRIWLNLGTLVLLLGIIGTARATQVMYSAPVEDNASKGMYCDIVDAGTTSIMGTISANSYGNIIEAGPQSFSIIPGQGASLYVPSPQAAYCKVTLTTGSTKKVRGVAIYNYGTTGAYTIPIQ